MHIKDSNILKNKRRLKMLLPVIILILLLILVFSFFYGEKSEEVTVTKSSFSNEKNILKGEIAEIYVIRKKIESLMDNEGYIVENLNTDTLTELMEKIDVVKESLNKKVESKILSKKNIEAIINDLDKEYLNVQIIRSKNNLQQIVNKLFVGNSKAIDGNKVVDSLALKDNILPNKLENISNQLDNVIINDKWKISMKKILTNAISQSNLYVQIKDIINKFYDREGNINRASDFSQLNEINKLIINVSNKELKNEFINKIQQIKAVESEIYKEQEENKKLEELRKEKELEKKEQEEKLKKQQEEQIRSVEELRNQQEELHRQQEELRRQQEELRRQQEEQQKAEEELRRQQENQ